MMMMMLVMMMMMMMMIHDDDDDGDDDDGDDDDGGDDGDEYSCMVIVGLSVVRGDMLCCFNLIMMTISDVVLMSLVVSLVLRLLRCRLLAHLLSFPVVHLSWHLCSITSQCLLLRLRKR